MKQSRLLPWLIPLLTFLSIYIDTSSALVVPWLKINRDISFHKGLDLAGGTSVTLKADMSKIPNDQKKQALDSAKDVIERRVNLFGVREPVVRSVFSARDARVVVELPGVADVKQAAALVGKTAQLEFRKVGDATASAEIEEKSTPTGLTGADIKSAQVSFDNQRSGEPVVAFTIADKSQKKFFDTIIRLIGKRMAIFLDNQFISAPTVQNAIRDSGQISGRFTTEEAKRLATQLNAGALPVPLSILEQKTIGATLGQSSLEKSLFAAAVGFLAIVIFMTVLYGWLGVVASVSLVLYSLFTLVLFKLIPITLTLAGIAGFILSIGMAVDANILIFERMREEKRKGKTPYIALELGFTRAWSSIRDSNISSIITAFILFQFGTGTVRGFAITLFLGVVVSMFTAINVTRTILRIIYRENSKHEI